MYFFMFTYENYFFNFNADINYKFLNFFPQILYALRIYGTSELREHNWTTLAAGGLSPWCSNSKPLNPQPPLSIYTTSYIPFSYFLTQ